MATPGAKYRAVGGTLITPWGDNGVVIEVKRGVGLVTSKGETDVSGPDDGGNPVFSIGNDVYSANLIGEYKEGTADQTGATYVAATNTLSKTGAFANVGAGQFIYVSGGTGVTAGWYEIATVVDDDSVTLVTDPAAGSPSDVAFDGTNIIAIFNQGVCTIQFGHGETWTGDVLIRRRQVIADWENPNAMGVSVSLLYTGAVTVTTGAV